MRDLCEASQDGKVVGAMRVVQWRDCQMKPFQGTRTLTTTVRAGGMGIMRRGGPWWEDVACKLQLSGEIIESGTACIFLQAE
jgi:hypothetical protein